jgi:hypothetical protein
MVKEDLINSENYEEITNLSRKSIEIIKEIRQ